MTFRRNILPCLAAFGLALPIAAAKAAEIKNEGLPPSDPVMAWAEQLQPPNQFTLNSAQDTELVAFHHEHMISVCAPHVDHANLDDASHAVPVVVTADGEQHTISPGNCLMIEAKKLSVKPAGPLGANTDLVGTVRVLR